MRTAQSLKRISILATEGVFGSTLLHAKDFFHMASLRYGKQLGLELKPAFETLLVSPDGQPVTTFSGTLMAVDGPLGEADAVILPAFWGDFDGLGRRYPEVTPWLQERHAAGSAICGEATGAFWMAAAGLLDEREATTHWRFAREFTERFPRVIFTPEKHLTDSDNLYCAGGTTSACDLYIHLVERFRRARRAGKSPADAIEDAASVSGRAIVIDAIAVCLGFGVLVCSQVPADARLGMLAILCIATCLLVTLVLLPIVMHYASGPAEPASRA